MTASDLFNYLAIFQFLKAVIIKLSSEIEITTHRVVYKTGVISRFSDDTYVDKVEGVRVNQSPLGRLLGYGTVIISGSGGKEMKLRDIANPLAFQRHIKI